MDASNLATGSSKRKTESVRDNIQYTEIYSKNKNQIHCNRLPEIKDYWSQYLNILHCSLKKIIVTNENGHTVSPDLAITSLSSWSTSIRQSGGTQFFIGNGASACMASHFAVDWSKNGSLPSLAFNDVAFLTAISNDLGYDQVFAKPIRYFCRSGDLLATISSSGNSPNVLYALETAKKMGMRIVTFSGMKSSNISRTFGDFNFYVPARTYGIVESAHQVLLHAWLDNYLGNSE